MVINEDVIITEYAPAVFNEIRLLDGLTSENICKSLNPENNRESVFKAKESAGKSGSFFFFSYDRQFIIKTMNSSELKVFRNALPNYFLHLKDNKNSIIARIYGAFTV
jgi:1-phosphatidylinositol-4-phosphate 5-kinase